MGKINILIRKYITRCIAESQAIDKKRDSEYKKAYYQANKEKFAEASRRWRANNRERYLAQGREYARKRKHKKQGYEGN